jgi:hypothetical protein
MVDRLKTIAKEKNVKRLYVSHENDNLPAIIANYMVGGKILYSKHLSNMGQKKAMFQLWRRDDLIFVFEL